MKVLTGLALLLALSACSSRSFKRDYEVVDASHQEIPEWINEPLEWAEDEDKKDYQQNRYYAYTSEPKNSRSIACEVAKARAASSIASEISQFIKQSLGSSAHGDASDLDGELYSYVEESLAKEVQSTVVGAKVHRSYWEKRRYLKEKGAAKDQEGYVCSALLKIHKDNLELAFNRANEKLVAKADNSEAKSRVAKAVKEAQEAMLKQ